MNQFNDKLDRAKARQRSTYLHVVIVAIVLVVIVVSLLVLSQGTRVEIRPDEAQLSAELRLKNTLGFVIGKTVYTVNRQPQISVTSPGFKDFSQIIPPEHLGGVFPVELEELPGRLTIDIVNSEGEPSGTIWRIDGNEVARSSKLDTEYKAGVYTVTVDNKYFQLEELDVEIKRGERTALETSLQPVPGMLSISSTPSNATVFVDDKNVGATPLQLEIGGGHHKVSIERENYLTTVDHVEIVREKSAVTRDYKLEVKKGRIIFKLSPKGGKLLVDGVLVENPLTLDALSQHRISYLKDGYYPESKLVTLKADEVREDFFSLNPELGVVSINTSPPADIWIGEKKYGLSPINIELPAISHQVAIKKPGYRTVVQEVRPEGGAVKKISIALLTEYQARLQQAPLEFTSVTGIKLKLFLVNDTIITGAPRSEKGQRANEFQRNVRLTKPFYVSVYEITNGQFAQFLPEKTKGNTDTPVTSISWQEAAAYCNWLSAKEDLTPFYSFADGNVTSYNSASDGYRLLSEAEWEWLARKAGKSKQTIFSWGNETVIPAKAANIADESAKGSVRFFVPNYTDGYASKAPVGSQNREFSGLFDIAGNVSEWVHDTYSIIPPLTREVIENPFGPEPGQTHVIKGANYRSGTITTLRPAFREGLSGIRDDVGFRIARYLYGGDNE